VPLGVAVIGCGAIARRAHAPALRAAGATIVAFASRSQASAEAARDEGGGTGDVVVDWRSVLDRKDVDAVTICTPNALHAEMAVTAAEAGKHVLVEKPIATTLADADAMVAAAARGGVVLMTAHNLRFAAPFVAARESVARGDVGVVTGVRASFGHGGPAAWAPDATWFFDRALSGGGALIDLGIHMADLLRSVTSDEVVEVAAMTFGSDDGVEDAGAAVLRFANGAVGSLQASWIAKPGPDHELTIFGTDGTLHLDSRTPLTLHAVGGEAEEVKLPTGIVDPYAAFVDAVTTGTAPPVTGEDGRAALAIIDAAYRSAATGATVGVR
jgi:predicted dehydrogenase